MGIKYKMRRPRKCTGWKEGRKEGWKVGWKEVCIDREEKEIKEYKITKNINRKY